MCPVEPGPGPRKRSDAPTQKLPEKWTDDQAFWVFMETSYTVSTKSLATVTAWASRPSARPPKAGGAAGVQPSNHWLDGYPVTSTTLSWDPKATLLP